MRMTTVPMKPKPSAKAANLRFFFSNAMFSSGSTEEDNSSEVIRSIIAVIASQRLTSDKERGKFTL